MRQHLLLLLLFSCSLIGAQQKVYVRGYVLDEKKHPVEFANVAIEGTVMGTASNEQGYYELGVNLCDSFTIVYSCIGYESVKRTIVPKSERSFIVNVNLPFNAEELAELEVRAYKRQTTTMQTIDTDKLKFTPDASGGNIESLLTQFAGVNSTNEMSSQYSVRGGNYDENSVYVNNIEVYRPLLIRAGQQEGLSFINPDMVDKVEFSAGGYDAKYGDKTSSVLNVSYKKPTRFEASAAISLLGASAHIGSSSKKFTQLHGIRYKTNRYLLGTLDTEGEYSPTYFDYQIYLTFALAKKWELTFLGNISQNSYNFIPQSRTTSFGTISTAQTFKVYFSGKEKDLFRTFFGALTLNYKPTENISLSLLASGFNTNERETYDITGEYWLSELDMGSSGSNSDDTPVLGTGTYHEHARNRLSATVANIAHQGSVKHGENMIEWGVNFQREIILDRINEWEFRDSAGYSMPNNGNTVQLISNLYSNVDLYSNRFTAYAQDSYTAEQSYGKWYFNGGLRLNYWSFNNEALLSPRAMVAFFPNWKQDFTFRLAAGLYYQAPFYKEIRLTETDAFGNNYITLNTDIKAQRTFHLVGGMDYYFRAWDRPFRLTVEGYYKPADRVISYYVDNVRVRYSGKNDAVAYSAGIDVKLFGEFVPGTDSWISFSWMRSREDILDDSYSIISNAGNNLGTIYPGYISRPNEQRYNISLFFQDYFPNHPEYKVSLKLVWSDGLPFGPPNSERYQAVLRTKAYRRVDLGASRGFSQGRERFMRHLGPVKNTWLNLELFNLFNIKNVNSYYWITDIYNQQYAVPNYLTGFMLNFRVAVDF